MQKLLNYICNELDELEKRIEQGSVTYADIQYGDTLAHFEKNLLTADAMMKKHSGSGHEDDGHMSEKMSKRMSKDEAKDELVMHLRDIMRNSNDDDVKNIVRNWIRETEY